MLAINIYIFSREIRLIWLRKFCCELDNNELEARQYQAQYRNIEPHRNERTLQEDNNRGDVSGILFMFFLGGGWGYKSFPSEKSFHCNMEHNPKYNMHCKGIDNLPSSPQLEYCFVGAIL